MPFIPLETNDLLHANDAKTPRLSQVQRQFIHISHSHIIAKKALLYRARLSQFNLKYIITSFDRANPLLVFPLVAPTGKYCWVYPENFADETETYR